MYNRRTQRLNHVSSSEHKRDSVSGNREPLLPLDLEEPVRLEMREQLDQLLAGTITLRDLYRKAHWQIADATCYHLDLLIDEHYRSKLN